MVKPSKFLMPLYLSIVLITQTSTAQQPQTQKTTTQTKSTKLAVITDCNIFVKDCETVVDEGRKLIQIQDELIARQQDQNELLKTQVTSLGYDLSAERSDRERLYNDPKIVGPTAFILGWIFATYVQTKFP